MKRLPSPAENRIQALQNNRYLTGLDDQILAYLVQHTELLGFDADETIMLEGQDCRGLYFISRGRVKLYRSSAAGREIIINIIGEGESFNEVAVFDRGRNPVSAGAITPAELWLIDAGALREVVEDHPGACRQIIVNLSENLRMMVGKVAELTFFSVTGRLARLLWDLPEEQLSGSGHNRLTQDDLASRIGTVREVVARSLKELERVGAIQVDKGNIRLLDRQKLVDWE